MQLIHIILKFWVLIQIFLLLPTDLSATVSVDNDYQHHLYDFEIADEESTQQHQQKNDLPISVSLICSTVSGIMEFRLYPSPYFELTAPPPEC